MSRKRAVQRKLHVKPAEGFAKEVGAALERYGRRGGALKEAARSLVRYAAQTAAMAGIDEAQFERLARAAYDKEAQRIGYARSASGDAGATRPIPRPLRKHL